MMSKRFTVFEVPEIPPLPEAGDMLAVPMAFAEGTAFEIIASLLDSCSLTELETLKLRGVAAAQRRVAGQVRDFEVREYGRTGVMFPAVTALAEECDEPCDADATPLEGEPCSRSG